MLIEALIASRVASKAHDGPPNPYCRDALRRRHAGLSLAFSCLLTGAVHGQASSADRVLAQSLFEQGRNLMAAGRYSEACPKLAESQRLDPGGGTLLNLAQCHELEGHVASAWAEYKEALGIAKRDQRPDRVRVAEEQIRLLEPKLPRLTVQVAQASRLTGLEVHRNGGRLSPAAWGSPQPVDPGRHTIVARAPGRRPWSRIVEVGPDGDAQTVEVPVLSPLPARRAAPASMPSAVPEARRPRAQSSMRQTFGFALLGTGVACVAVGSYFGISSLNKRAESDSICDRSVCPTRDREAVRLNDEAHRDAWIANIGIGIGLISAGAGAYLLLTPTAQTAQRMHLGIAAAPSGFSLAASRSW
jgi:hypothetical protein